MHPQLPLPEFATPQPEEADTRYETAPSMDDLQFAREMGRNALQLRMSEAQNDLGGGIESAQLEDALADQFGEFIDDQEPWKRDINATFERFNLISLLPDAIEKMTVEDRTTLALHFDEHVLAMKHKARVLVTDGSAEGREFQDYDFPSVEAAIAYGHELKAFTQAIEQTPAYELLRDFASSKQLPSTLRSRRILQDTQKHGTVTVVHDKKYDKIRIQRIKS